MKACVVDDDYTSRVLLKNYLIDEGWEVVEFKSPNYKSENKITNLKEELAHKNTKLLIMDVRFGREEPGLRLGLATIKSLVESGDIKDSLVIILVSQFGKEQAGYNDLEPILQNRNIQNHWLDKPIEFVHLNEILRSI